MQKVFHLLILLILLLHQNTFSQYHTDKKLESKLLILIDSFHGTVGIYVRNLKTGKEVAINADTIFPTAVLLSSLFSLAFLIKFRKLYLPVISQFGTVIRWLMKARVLCSILKIVLKRI